MLFYVYLYLLTLAGFMHLRLADKLFILSNKIEPIKMKNFQKNRNTYIHFQTLLNFHLEDMRKPLDEQINLYLMSENSSTCTGIYNLNDEFAKCLMLMFLL